MAEPEGRLRQLVEGFGRVCKRRKLRIYESKSNLMKCMRVVDGRCCGKGLLTIRWMTDS